MISANNITLRLGKKALFEDVNIKFTEGNCYGLIGANGAGKSTFLKILSGELDSTNGDIVITPGQRLSVLEHLLLNFVAKPDFIAYKHEHYDNLSRKLATGLFGNVSACYTIKNQEEYEASKEYFELVIFDSFIPE